MGHQPRTLLPSVKISDTLCKLSSQVRPSVKCRHDQHSKDFKELLKGDHVRVRCQNTRSCPTRATIIKACDQPRSYEVKTECGNILRRNRRDLLCTKESSAIPLRDVNYDDISPLPCKQPHVAAPQDEHARSDSNSNSGKGHRARSGRLVRKAITYQDNM